VSEIHGRVESCTSCGGEISLGARFCRHCGAKMPATPSADSMPTIRTSASPPAVGATPPMVLASADVGTDPRPECGNCGADTKVGAIFCPRCGAELRIRPKPSRRPPDQPSAPTSPTPHGRRLSMVAVIAVVLLCAAVGAGAILLLGGKRKPDHRRTSQTTATVGSHAATSTTNTNIATVPTTPQETPPAAETAVVALLGRYQTDYSAHDIAGLSSAFSADVMRRGLAASGCTVSKGRAAVVSAYESQFAEGSGTYRLIGLTPQHVELRGSSNAYVNVHYQISPGGSGSVSFTLIRERQEWKIKQVYATCA
jgi:Double zinc ribbon